MRFFNDSFNHAKKKKSSADLSTFLSYYCEIILVFPKLKDLVNSIPTFDNIASIISKVSKN